MVFSHWVVCEDDGRAGMGHAGLASPVDRPLKLSRRRAPSAVPMVMRTSLSQMRYRTIGLRAVSYDTFRYDLELSLHCSNDRSSHIDSQ